MWAKAGASHCYAAAADERIKAAMVSCAFGPREGVHDEPLDPATCGANCGNSATPKWSALIHPRKFGIDPCARLVRFGKVRRGYWPEWNGPVAAQNRQETSPPPGTLKAIKTADAEAEWKRFVAYSGKIDRPR